VPVPPRWRRRLRAWLRRSSFAWWMTVAALALVSTLVVRSSLDAATGAAKQYGALRTVPVVLTPVAAGGTVPEGAVALAPRPASTVPDGALAAAEGWAGRTALVPLVPGEVLLASKVAPEGVRGPAALLPEGTRALAIPSGPGGRPPLEVGDRVDVLVTLADATPDDPSAPPTVEVAAAALVVDVDGEADAVTVAVPAGEAPAVAYAVTTGAVSLALVSGEEGLAAGGRDPQRAKARPMT